MKLKFLTVATLIASSLLAGQSHAAAFSGEWTWNKTTPGTSFIPLRPKASHFCFLTKVEFEETDTAGEASRCRVYRSTGSDWILEAHVATGDAAARCTTICYTN